MAINPGGVFGALFDSEVTNALGGLNTGLGFGIHAVYGPPAPPYLSVTGAGVPVVHIGLAETSARACGFATKALRVETAAAPVAADAAFPDTYVNRTGKLCPTGASVIAVQP